MTDAAEWPFPDPANVATITLRQIIEEEHPILFVSHDADDGGWQFLGPDAPAEEDARVVSLQRVFQTDPTTGELADLPLGWCAWRDQADSPWQRAPNA